MKFPETPKVISSKPLIERHKAAIVRSVHSKPVRLALEAELFQPDSTFFDYGCGRGIDIEYIAKQGFESNGWDPYFSPETPHISADIVNLGYVINVIEDTAERRQALLNAWNLTQKVLIVSAQVLIENQIYGFIAYGDGVITSRNTFQKYYEQEELKTYIDQALNVDAVPVALGIYFVFRDETQAESFRASRFRSRAMTPRIRLNVKRFEDYKDLLAPLMEFMTERGRLPRNDEVETLNFTSLQKEFGNVRRAFQLVLQATDVQGWDEITDKRRQDLLVYLALSHFGRRPKFRDLESLVQNDIKSLFGSYQQACTAADLMLVSLGKTEVIDERCQNSCIGKKLTHSLLVHVTALDKIDPLLRLYEGCASRTIGRPQEATVIKFHIYKPKISYLFYPDFDTEPHPALHMSMQIDLRDLHVNYEDFNPEDNPPLLHQKDQVVPKDYIHYEKFAKLSQQEINWGLLDDFKSIRNRNGWLRCLEQHCADLRGHRVVWRKNADPYQVKLLQSARRKRSI